MTNTLTSMFTEEIYEKDKETQEKIYREVQNYYNNVENRELSEEDVLHMVQIRLFAEQEDLDVLEQEAEDRIEDFFESVNLIGHRGNSTLERELTVNEAREQARKIREKWTRNTHGMGIPRRTIQENVLSHVNLVYDKITKLDD